VKFLLDEQLSPQTALALNALGSSFGQYEHILDSQSQGMKDEQIPPLCRERSIDVLVTVNVRDFGAKKIYYEALLDEGISVVVLRPGRMSIDTLGQVQLITRHLRRVIVLLERAPGPVLVVVTPSDVRDRSIEELIAELS
jgi:hypothetical protein